jgi:DinB superfamily
MNARDAVKSTYALPDQLCRGYLDGLTDADLLVRPVPKANHIAWQLGHLITSEHEFVEGLCPGLAPPLPAGFAAKHKKEMAESDNPKDFCTKDEYLKLYDQMRAASLKMVDTVSESDYEKPAPEKFRSYCPTVAAVLLLVPSHWLMHAGQWAIVRRKLGKPPLF